MGLDQLLEGEIADDVAVEHKKYVRFPILLQSLLAESDRTGCA
jgi:hypothetical protein